MRGGPARIATLSRDRKPIIDASGANVMDAPPRRLYQ